MPVLRRNVFGDLYKSCHASTKFTFKKTERNTRRI